MQRSSATPSRPRQLAWDWPATRRARAAAPSPFAQELIAFRDFKKTTAIGSVEFELFSGGRESVPCYINEFWTARQRQAHSLHEISFRACFKPQLPRFFIDRLTRPGDLVYDPFMGRGTTPIEAALLGRVPAGNDISPLSRLMAAPRLAPPQLDAIAARLKSINLHQPGEMPDDLLVFYHPETLEAISSLRRYFAERRAAEKLDSLDAWLEMVCLNRLTGHSAGFFSVYTLPPNQAVSVQSQRKINLKRNQSPPRRDVRSILLKKSKQLLSDLTPANRAALQAAARRARWLTRPADSTPDLKSGSVSLVVTSPPFLNVVQYAEDNWLRCWFAGIDPKSVALSTPRRLDAWQEIMIPVFRELRRVLRKGGCIAFEVGEVHAGKTRLEEAVLPCGIEAGLKPELVMVNDQKFTKTANCWGIDNQSKGTNTNRIVLFRKT
ncbi:MAG: DNA methyltransferase [Verrucomicrobiota bacterium]